jgi:hypothetical protein
MPKNGNGAPVTEFYRIPVSFYQDQSISFYDAPTMSPMTIMMSGNLSSEFHEEHPYAQTALDSRTKLIRGVFIIMCRDSR